MALFDIIILLGDKYIMDYFTTKQGFFLYSSNIVEEELKKESRLESIEVSRWREILALPNKICLLSDSAEG